jgi:hypothetical protein
VSTLFHAFVIETTVFGTKKIFSEAKAIFFASESVFSMTKKRIPKSAG